MIVDDKDPSITYVGSGWVTDLNNSNAHGTDVVGDHATYKFKGSSVSVFGTISPGVDRGATSLYVLDGSPTGETFKAKSREDAALVSKRFYVSPELNSSEEHTLDMKLIATGGDLLFIDYLLVQLEEEDTSGTVITLTQSQTQPPSPSVGGATDVPAVSPPANRSQGGLSRGTIIGIAVGGAVSALFVAMAVIFLVRFLRRRNKTRDQESPNGQVVAFTSAVGQHSFYSGSHNIDQSGGGYVVRGGLSHEKTVNSSVEAEEQEEPGAQHRQSMLPTYTSAIGNQ